MVLAISEDESGDFAPCTGPAGGRYCNVSPFHVKRWFNPPARSFAVN
jgi:hypothetical protein